MDLSSIQTANLQKLIYKSLSSGNWCSFSNQAFEWSREKTWSLAASVIKIHFHFSIVNLPVQWKLYLWFHSYFSFLMLYLQFYSPMSTVLQDLQTQYGTSGLKGLKVCGFVIDAWSSDAMRRDFDVDAYCFCDFCFF